VLCGAEIWDCAMIKGGIWVADAQVLIHWLPQYRRILLLRSIAAKACVW
jgi:hypothetical protein